MKPWLICILAVALILPTGCTKDQHKFWNDAGEQIEENIPSIVKGAVTVGLKAWARKDVNAARDGATEIAKSTREVLLPYFQTGDAQLVAAAQEVLQNFGKKVPEQMQIAICAAIGAIEGVIKVPGPGKFMTKRQRDDVNAGLEALAKACEDFVKKLPKAESVPAPAPMTTAVEIP